MHEVIPAILAKNLADFKEKIERVAGASPLVQIDCEDGVFIPNTSFYRAHDVATPSFRTRCELHLMVAKPKQVLEEWLIYPGVIRGVIHAETSEDVHELLWWMNDHHIEACLAINPETLIGVALPYLDVLESILIMGVHPGAQNQKIIPTTAEKIRELRRIAPKTTIAVDGGITLENAPELLAAGATRLVVGSAIFGSGDPKAAIKKFRALEVSA